MPAMTSTNISELKKVYTGKVRDIYEIEPKKWLVVASDRISAFDCVFEQGIPEKGSVLNAVSNYWFSKINSIENHLLSTNPVDELPFLNHYPGINERSVIVKKVERISVECVVRGYLLGSVWKEYTEKGTACDEKLPEGIPFAGKVPEPIFTPADKNDSGHDENISHQKMFNKVGRELGERLMEESLKIYKMAFEEVAPKGILLADTKFEFGIDDEGKLILVDEVLTPDSSRYWDASEYVVGKSPKSFDKQFVRDYLSTLDWDKNPPAPALPDEIIEKTAEIYKNIQRIITE